MKKMVKKVVAIVSAMVMFICGLSVNPKEMKADAANNIVEQIAQLSTEMAIKINTTRMELGLKPVYVSPALTAISTVRAGEISVKYSHTRPDGTSRVTLIDKNVIPCIASNEIIQPGSSNVNTIFNQWKKSPNHWAAITDPNATHMGIGLFYNPLSADKWYWVGTFVQLKSYRTKLDGQEMIVNDATTCPVSLGDVNGDSFVDSFDVALLDKYIDGNIKLNTLQLEAADICYDGEITVDDATALRKYVLGEISNLNLTAAQAKAL